ncbi:MAG: carboxynorspermidine decarboxylase [Paludibacteraceae bacterium]|nr:carboxynorspermidine decarboxylase [Paludibacteraceae bacterium]
MFPNPCYIVEERLLHRNLALIKRVADETGVEIILAFKAFALWKTFPIFREYIQHTTASSVYEARLAYEQFGAPAHTYSPAYTEENFPEFLRYSSHITFNSLSQWERFGRIQEPRTENQEGRVSFGIRINPEYSEIETLLYNPTAPGSRFGVLAEQLETYCEARGGRLPEGLEGFHCHCHCEDDSYTFERTLQHIEAKFGKWFPQLQWLNLGGGHLMTRKDYDVEHLIGLLKGLRSRYPHLKILLEPGSAFAWQTGVLTSKVVDIVENHGIRTAILNVSFACHMPDTLEMPYQPAVRGARPTPPLPEATPLRVACGDPGKGGSEDPREVGSEEGYRYRLGGNSCLSGDWIGDWVFDHELQIGEEIIFEDMIHYTTVKTHMFNGIAHPSLGIRREDGTEEVLRTFDYEDYLNRMD